MFNYNSFVYFLYIKLLIVVFHYYIYRVHFYCWKASASVSSTPTHFRNE